MSATTAMHNLRPTFVSVPNPVVVRDNDVVSDNEINTDDSVTDAGNDDIGNNDAASSQLPAIRPLETPASPAILPTPSTVTPSRPVTPPPVDDSFRPDTPSINNAPGVSTSGVPARDTIDDNDALLLQPLPTGDANLPSEGASGNVGQFDVEETTIPQEIPDTPVSTGDSGIDSSSAADPLVVPRQTEPVQDSSNDTDAFAVADVDFDGVEDSIDNCTATSPGIPVNASGCDKYDGWLAGIGFLESSSRLSGESRDTLEEIIADLQNFPELVLELQVEATSGSEADTFLARRRTIEILRFVRSQGIAGNRLKSLPPSLPSASNSNGDAIFLRSLIAN